MQQSAKILCLHPVQTPWECLCALVAKGLMELVRCSGGGAPCLALMLHPDVFAHRVSGPLLPNHPSKSRASPMLLQTPGRSWVQDGALRRGQGEGGWIWGHWGSGLGGGGSGVGWRGGVYLTSVGMDCCLHPAGWRELGWRWDGNGWSWDALEMGRGIG